MDVPEWGGVLITVSGRCGMLVVIDAARYELHVDESQHRRSCLAFHILSQSRVENILDR